MGLITDMKKKREARQFMDEFQMMRLKALSNVSLKRPLSDSEAKEMFALAKELNVEAGKKPRGVK